QSPPSTRPTRTDPPFPTRRSSDLLRISTRTVGQLRLVDQERIAMPHLKGTSRTHTFSDSFCYFCYLSMRLFPPFLVKSSESPFEVNLVRDNICGAIADNFTPRQHRRESWIRRPAYYLLQRGDDLCRYRNRSDILMRMSSVTAFTSDRHIKLVGRSHVFTRPKADVPDFDERHDVLPNDCIGCRIFQHTLLYHDRGSTRKFFRPRLKNKLDRPPEFMP